MGITEDEAMMMLLNDIHRCRMEVARSFKWITNLNAARQDVLINMCFNLGITRLKTFQKALAAMEAGDWDTAADEMLDSAWARQVGDRAKELAEQMRRGSYPP